jgi:tRNA-uridine 2-sulfurtransferase
MHTSKAVSLISGGLDSMLATKAILEQGVHVEGLNFFTGFCVEGHTSAIRQRDHAKPKRNNALWVAEQLGIKLHIIDVVEEYKQVLLNPHHGYGAHLNPCLDCKVFMVKRALGWMEENHFDFIITGEVIGQRPMSQLKSKMPIIAKRSGADNRLLRPLSAQFLPPTLPEEKGWVDREKLFGFSGRSRKGQIALANDYGITEYAQPAGGCCFLTDKKYSEKLVDLWQAQGHREYELDDIILLKVGRHIRPRPNFKLIIGREEGENNFLEGYRKQYIHLRAIEPKGPLCLIDGAPSDADIEFAARIVAGYSQGRELAAVTIQVNLLDGRQSSLSVNPLPKIEQPITWNIDQQNKLKNKQTTMKDSVPT